MSTGDPVSPLLGPAPAAADVLVKTLTPARAEVFDRLISLETGGTVAELAARTGQHENTVRDHLDALVRAGLADRRPAATRGRGRPAWTYTVRPEGALGERAREYAGLAAALAGHISRTSTDPRADALAAGEAWGAELVESSRPGRAAAGRPNRTAANCPNRAAPDPPTIRSRVVELLDQLGFAPRSAGLTSPAGEPPASPRTSSPGKPLADERAVPVRLTRCPLLEVARRYPEVVCWVHLGVARGAVRALGGNPDRLAVRPFAEPGACLLDLPADP